MGDVAGSTQEQSAFLADLIDQGLLLPSGVAGVYGRGAVFGRVTGALEELISSRRIADVVPVERPTFPPVLPRRQLEELGYLASFPHLAGTIFSFHGNEADAAWRVEHEDWDAFQGQTELALVPAACYPTYPVVAARGPL